MRTTPALDPNLMRVPDDPGVLAGHPVEATDPSPAEDALQVPWRIAALIRFAVAATIAVYVVAYQAPPGVIAPTYVLPIGLAIAADLAVLALLQSLTRRPPGLAMSAVYLMADLASPIAMLYLFAFDPRAHLFVLLFVSMAQGALVLQRKGALVAWSICSFAYVLLELRAEETSGVAAIPLVVGLRVGIMFFIALLIAQLTSRFEKGAVARQRAERSLRYQAGLLENVNDAVLATDIDMRITAWNAAAEHTYGWTQGEAIGRPMHEILRSRLISDGSDAVGSLKASGDFVAEFVQVHKDGHPVYVEAKAMPLLDDDGLTVGYVTVNRDITERRRAVEATTRAERSEQAARAKDEFLSRVSHELRTPLNAVLGFAQLLALDELGDDQRQNVQEIMRGGQHLLTLIDDVLEIARIESDHITIETAPVRVQDTFEDAVHIVGFLAADRNIEIDATVQDLWVFADAQRLKQVFINLLSNAIKYNHPGGQVSLAAARSEGGYVRIDVSDTGPGIAPDRIGRLFLPFERLGAEQTDVQGTGLGLALSRNLVEAMGGQIGVDAEVGEGSDFWILLPEAEPVAGELIDVGPAAEHLTQAAHTILYVEDNLSNLRLVESVLRRRADVRLIPAMQGGVGLELAAEHKPDLILLDVHLPDIPGDEVLGRLRADPRTADIPVVTISADATDAQQRRMLGAGSIEFLAKPIDISRFLEIVDGLGGSAD